MAGMAKDRLFNPLFVRCFVDLSFPEDAVMCWEHR